MGLVGWVARPGHSTLARRWFGVGLNPKPLKAYTLNAKARNPRSERPKSPDPKGAGGLNGSSVSILEPFFSSSGFRAGLLKSTAKRAGHRVGSGVRAQHIPAMIAYLLRRVRIPFSWLLRLYQTEEQSPTALEQGTFRESPLDPKLGPKR